MVTQWKFESALEIWKSWQSAASEDMATCSETDFDNAEQFILGCIPTSFIQVEQMLAIVADNLQTGPHWDGREVTALKNVRAFINEICAGSVTQVAA